VVLEHFNFEMQFLLDDYCASKISFEKMCKDYKIIDSEGSQEIKNLRYILVQAKENKKRIKLYSGCLPWAFACLTVQNGINKTLE
jgi:hypothetical protein